MRTDAFERSLNKIGINKAFDRLLNKEVSLSRARGDGINTWVTLFNNMGWDYNKVRYDPFFKLSSQLQDINWYRRQASAMEVRDALGLPVSQADLKMMRKYRTDKTDPDVMRFKDEALYVYWYMDEIDLDKSMKQLGRYAASLEAKRRGAWRRDRGIERYFEKMYRDEARPEKEMASLGRWIERKLEREDRDRRSYLNESTSLSAIRGWYRTVGRWDETISNVFSTMEDVVEYYKAEKKLGKRDILKGINGTSEFGCIVLDAPPFRSRDGFMKYVFNMEQIDPYGGYDVYADRVISEVFDTSDEFIRFQDRYYMLHNMGYNNIVALMRASYNSGGEINE